MESNLELPVKVWMGIVIGWRKRILSVQPEGYIIRRQKENKHIFSKSNSVFFSLENSLLLPPTKDPLEIIIEIAGNQNIIKTETEAAKTRLYARLEEVIKSLGSKKAFSNDFKGYKEEIDKSSSQAKTTFQAITLRMTFFQNLFFEMNQKINSFDQLIKVTKIKKNKEEFVKIYNGFFCIREEMKKQFDELIEKVYAYHDEKEPENAFKYKKEIEAEVDKQSNIMANIPNIPNLPNIITIPPIISINEPLSTNNISIGLSALDEDISDVSDNEIESSKKRKAFIDPSLDAKHYTNPSYSFPTRTNVPLVIKCSKNMISEFMKTVNNKKTSLPIYFNEPISMLQKQCEKFYHSDLLNKAAESTMPEMQLCHIAAFIIGEISFNCNRVLKPFNPILGETFEYYDNERKYRYLSEQVSHEPPITAFIGEGSSFAMFGDTRASTSFKFLKGAVEFEFGNKIHLILKRTKDYYVFNRPLLLMKGLIVQPLRYDYNGTVVISNVNCPSIKATLTFIEESKKTPLGSFEGKVTQNDQVVYTLGGNWNTHVYYADPEGNNKVTLLTIEDEEFRHNTPETYRLPKYSCNFNILTPELQSQLPMSDTRLRQDMRIYEEGKVEPAQEIKRKIEEKQVLRHLKFEEEKLKYVPTYFKNENMTQSLDCVYCYKGGYWESKLKKSFKESDIFTIGNK